MARSLFALVAGLSALLPVGAARAEPPPAPKASPEDGRRGPGGDGKHDDGEGPMKRFREKFKQLSPEERDQFRENFKRWKDMGPGERRDWQHRAGEEHERFQKSVDEAIAKAGLSLSADQREVFIVRYRQERRKIEEQLRQEMDAKREQKIDDVLAQLKTEFAAAAKPSTPTPSPTP